MQNNSKKKYPVNRMNISINMEKTGANIKRVIKESGYTMLEIMEITGITTEQAIYKWYNGKSIPSLETLLILCKLFGLRIMELLVLDGKFDLPGGSNPPDEASVNNTVIINRRQFTDCTSRRLAAYYRMFYRDAV